MKCIRKTNLGQAYLRYLSFALYAPSQSHTLLNLRRRQRAAGIGGKGMPYTGRAAVEDSVSRCLRFGPTAVRYGTHPFLDGDEPIGRDLLKSFVQATWPIHVDIR